jgi:hypothetical protein
MLGWLRQPREREDRHLVKGATPAPAEMNPLEELSRIVGEAQALDRADERRYGRPRPSRDQRRRSAG